MLDILNVLCTHCDPIISVKSPRQPNDNDPSYKKSSMDVIPSWSSTFEIILCLHNATAYAM